MSDKKYILEGHEPKETDLMTWAKWFSDREKSIVKQTYIPKDGDPKGIMVSTVFLGIDHQYGEGEPLLFETMIFGINDNEYQERYSTWEEAEAGHEKAIATVFEVT